MLRWASGPEALRRRNLAGCDQSLTLEASTQLPRNGRRWINDAYARPDERLNDRRQERVMCAADDERVRTLCDERHHVPRYERRGFRAVEVARFNPLRQPRA